MMVNCVNATERLSNMKTEKYTLGLLTKRLLAALASLESREKARLESKLKSEWDIFGLAICWIIFPATPFYYKTV